MMRVTRITWGALFIILLAVILVQWDKMEPEVEDTALMMASREILSSANEFKNYWVVNGQPASMNKDNIEVIFSKSGWPLVLNDNKLDCEQWLHLLLPRKEKIYADTIKVHDNATKKEQYQCSYGASNGKMISVMLINGVFKVSVGFLDEG
ncbi:type IV pilus, mannose-sensitive hemagglutinin protein MshF [Aliivibrio sp. S2TY2]|uniref:type IV pilus, mannose-sensitive hemagglutinin protein MshF n=1 Tax=unclassified Aliivibrio TaxID=2645654 RepID=UPI0023780131|nr:MULTISPECIES: type IV pilus, mannose-sensitive hemagglutinin protein MshF [unclassified Aliivibrio]MDD9175572.1 type IV pilus, mannose-sensitive hemagglutinin protein MshF [Aliivibrio sp. S3TY1]MDD9192651.1 type IV pilus, mannose-sensitive hemagglutinin protein MshF [Aliivibrio sp. S2TY2]